MKPLTFLRDAVRAKEIVTTLVRHGFAEVLRDTETPVGWITKLTAPEHVGLTTWQHIRMICEDLGPTFVKVGQILSSRGDFLPQPLIEELKYLRNQVRPEPYDDIRKVIERELDGAPEELFTDIEVEPLACGSMAQVHRARLKTTGEYVVLKVQRPGIEKSIQADMEILGWLAKQLNKRIEGLRPWDLPAVVEELRQGLRLELDFTQEARYAELFNARNPYPKEVFAPKVFQDLSTRRLLVSEWIDGINIDDPKLPPESRCLLAKAGAKSVFHQIIIDGFFHGDPHGGNILAAKDGRLCLLDWGLTGQLTRQNRHHLADLLDAVSDSDISKVARIAQSMTRGFTWVDEQQIEKEVAAVLAKYGALPPDANIGRIIFDLMYVFGSNGIPVARDYTLLAKAIVSLTESAHSLDPTLSIAEAASPFLKQLAWERWNPEAVLKRTLWQVGDSLRRLHEMPADMQRVLRRFEREDLKINLHHQNLDNITDQATSAINRLVLAIITGALIIGSSLVIRANVPPLIWGSYSFIGVVGYTGSVLLGVWIIFDILRHGRHR
ncbi:MAG: AarF/UbiB family protein [Verrucomicrobiota bacterium]|nr:AarF/UbiB family protein [Verrucomicrobiota bacterium]